MSGAGMTITSALQALCDERRVKLIPGIVRDGETVRAVLMAYKLDAEGKVERQVEIPAMGPKASPAAEACKHPRVVMGVCGVCGVAVRGQLDL